MEGSINRSNNKRVAATNQRKGFQGIRLQNPFTLKVGQVFTGFGIGCVLMNWGSLFSPKNDDNFPNLLPMETCAIPMLGQVMTATRGATDVLSGVSRHVNGVLLKLGAKNIQAGIGCGVGLGHGFGVGVGLAVKPGVVHQIQCCIMETMATLMMKLEWLPIHPSMKIVSKLADPTSQGLPGPGNMSRGSAYEKESSKSPTETSFGTRTEKVLNSFLQNPVLKEDETSPTELVGWLRTENNMLQLVLKHQQIIEELMKENHKLRRILMEDLKIPPRGNKGKIDDDYQSRVLFGCVAQPPHL
ncbi:Dynamin-like protein [Hibiscus syriacus]|uniref:Dynamin-like protein n=1 Tax=Hibiscus syriacus TaxID=106335 RepID=A0A6A2ZES8_HIBSY|nr:Dynamin-like protein [Hibiscus syriacus]